MAWELKFMEWGNGWWRSPFLDGLVPWVTYLGSHYAVAVFILLTLLLTKRKKVFFNLLFLYAVQSAVVYSIKFLVNRKRPLIFLEMVTQLPKSQGEILDPSFPSAHTFCAFMMATLLATWFPKYKLVFFIMAGLIGWTRIYLGLHYPTDVIVGGLLGYGITKLFLHFRPIPSLGESK
jgi:undecaprenyl-diphosphatase